MALMEAATTAVCTRPGNRAADVHRGARSEREPQFSRAANCYTSPWAAPATASGAQLRV